jgi:hypothetical protein
MMLPKRYYCLQWRYNLINCFVVLVYRRYDAVVVVCKIYEFSVERGKRIVEKKTFSLI